MHLIQEKDGFLDIKLGEMSEGGINLYNWLCKQRKEYQAGKMTQEHMKKLKKLSVSLNPTEESWEVGIVGMKAYYGQYGDINIPIGYVDPNGMALGKWPSHQRELSKWNLRRKENQATRGARCYLESHAGHGTGEKRFVGEILL